MSGSFSMLSVFCSGLVCALYLEQVIVRIDPFCSLCSHVPSYPHRP